MKATIYTTALSSSLALACAALLSGCMSGILPKAQERAVYALPSPQSIRAARPLPAALLVEMPLASAPLDGHNVVVIREDGEVQVLPGVRWAAAPSQLLQGLIAGQLESAASAPSVAQSGQAHAVPLRLAVELRAFELRDRDGDLSAHAATSLRLVCSRNAAVLAASPLLGVDSGPLPDGTAAAVAALRDSAAQLAQQIVTWLDQVDASSCPLD